MRVALPPAFLGAPLAHRGFHDAQRPENSLSAFRAAAEAGYGIELDVQLTADGQALVFHDETLDRMAGRAGVVHDMALADLAGVRLGPGEEQIPTLAQVLDLVAGRVPVLIELKDRLGTFTPGDGRLEAAVAAALDRYAGPVAVMSFNPHLIATMADVAPEVPRGLTTEDYEPSEYPDLPPARLDALRDIVDFDRVGASFISHKASDLARPRVAELKARRNAILCWTIRAPEQEALARRIADNVTFEGYRAAIPA